VLPMLKITLHDALVTDLPLCDSPADYIYAEADYVNNIIQELLALTQRKELNSARFTGHMIYRRLIVYNFVHLMFCTSDESLLNEFEETLQQWRSWDNITVIQNHQLIKDNLLDLFRRGLNMQSNSILHSEELFHRQQHVQETAYPPWPGSTVFAQSPSGAPGVSCGPAAQASPYKGTTSTV